MLWGDSLKVFFTSMLAVHNNIIKATDMNKISFLVRRRGSINAFSLVAAIACTSTAHAITFNIGEIEGQFDSNLSVGSSWAKRNADPYLVSIINGGKALGASDDGRLNFKKGETFSKIFKGLHDIELKYGDSGLFVRGKYWYDFELKDESRAFREIDEHNRKAAARSSGTQLLDMFVYHNYNVVDQPGSIRLGKQVVSWGESTFIFNSINSINPVDVSAFRRPGAEIKEGLIPVNMFYVSQSITENLSAEVFYQLEWDQTVLDNCGTFFGADVGADGCDSTLSYGTSPAEVDLLNASASLLNVSVGPEGVVIPRGADQDARDSGQWGLALRWLGDNTEYGTYIMNYHSRAPIYATRTANATSVGYALGLLNLDPTGLMTSASILGNGQYAMDYPEDIRLYGASFATTLPSGTAWSGEMSYRPNMPLQVNSNDITGQLVSNVMTPFINSGFNPSEALAQSSKNILSYQRKHVSQVQTSLVHIIDNYIGADHLTLVGELAATEINGLERFSDIRYGRSREYSPTDNHGYYTSNSWGYRARASLEYSNVLAGVLFRPTLAWSHDVDGYSPTFNEGSKAISIGLEAEYMSTYTAGISVTDFFGGNYNAQVDRDFISVNFGINF